MGTDFDTIAQRYDAWYSTPLGAWADRLETTAIFHYLEPRPGERLLDLGTGTGRYAAAAARRGMLVTGVDASPAMLAVARVGTAGGDVRLVRAELTALPFGDARFDAVLGVTILCFVAEPLAALREAARVLRPGGRLVLGELNRWSIWSATRRLQGLVRPTTYRQAHFHGSGELCRLCKAVGLRVTGWAGLLHLPPCPSARCLQVLAPLEHLGQRYMPRFGAFLVVVASKPME